MSIGGWDKVDRLATTLMKLEGLALTTEVVSIVELHEELLNFDQKSLDYPRYFKKNHGRFALSKNSTGHFGEESMKGASLRSGLPPCHRQKVAL